jgi:4-hydroxy-2-oxoheptanedioate aldolase
MDPYKPETKAIPQRLDEGAVVFGVITNLPSPGIAELLALANFDIVMMDMEHGPLTYESLENCVRAVERGGSVPFARVAENNPKLILRALDAGARGIMVPAVNSRQELENCLEAARYAPEGSRGLAMTTMAARYGAADTQEYIAEANAEVAVLPQIESAVAYRALDDLLAVSGVDSFVIGPSDLSQSMGHIGQPEHSEVERTLRDIIQRCREAGTPVGTVAANPQRAADLVDMGVQVVLTGVNNLLMDAGCSFVNTARDLTGP